MYLLKSASLVYSASARFALAIPLRVYVGVLWTKNMPVNTVSFSRVNSSIGYSSPNIDSLCYWFKMIWVYASSVTTEMIESVTFRNSSHPKLIGKSMGKERLSLVFELAIASRVKKPRVIPARFGSLDVVIESLLGGKMVGHRESIPFGVMRAAVSAARPLYCSRSL